MKLSGPTGPCRTRGSPFVLAQRVLSRSWLATFDPHRCELQKKREEFWDTQPYYGGDRGTPWLSVSHMHLLYVLSSKRQAANHLASSIPEYGAVIWDALKAACEADQETCKLIIESAGIIVAAPDMTICYDERGKGSPERRGVHSFLDGGEGW